MKSLHAGRCLNLNSGAALNTAPASNLSVQNGRNHEPVLQSGPTLLPWLTPVLARGMGNPGKPPVRQLLAGGSSPADATHRPEKIDPQGQGFVVLRCALRLARQEHVLKQRDRRVFRCMLIGKHVSRISEPAYGGIRKDANHKG